MTDVTLTRDGAIAVLTIDNPPVNAINGAIRTQLLALADACATDPDIEAVILTGAGKLFVGGADITEFDRPVEGPTLPEVIARIEKSPKPWTAAIHGVAFGGGLEITLGCRFRVAAPGTKLGLPEVNLGIIPGAGGTQRLPRLIGIAAAIPVVAEMTTLSAAEAQKLGLVDAVVEGDLLAGAIAFAREKKTQPLAAERSPEAVSEALWAEATQRIGKSAKGNIAPLKALESMRYGVEHGIADGLKNERALFLELRKSAEAAALRHLFFAERAAPRPADLKGVTARPVHRVGVVGGGTMGVGIAAALRDADLPVVLVERDAESRDRAEQALAALFDAARQRGRLTAEAAAARRAGAAFSTDFAALADCDLVIEAVFEDLAVKRDVFRRLATACRDDAILATNTSYLDPGKLAEDLPDPGRLIGLHFFSPAQVMKLLEIIPTPQTRPEVLAAGFALAQKLGKIPVRAGICDGFIGNRILRSYRGEAEVLLRSGVAIEAIDGAMRDFGMAMGPFEVQDLSGLDISYLHREAARARGESVPESPGDILVRAGRKGQKTGGGWYDYQQGDRKPRPSAETERLLAPMIAGKRTMAAAEIADRLIGAMAAEGQAILDEGIAASPSDIDLVQVHGYGFPRWRGGPMFLRARKQA
ncbi:3-hydroxyacyl-CoA dehydrogenase NAD-binding domain-containing protein [Dongia sp.]|uniref:3-hydroxyacyl-CoA dehydrogenase NAD-binding domain-containing protein n=1 Tax=Dongia sp. TaxID=1977262 RepID=UPI003752FC1B